MTNRIKYILGFMTFCILGVILTQGVWLYKDYTYYSGQPLFSTDFDVFMPADAPSVLTNAKSIIAYSTTINASDSQDFARRTARLPAIVAYPATIAMKVVPRYYPKMDSMTTLSPRIAVTAPGSTHASFQRTSSGLRAALQRGPGTAPAAFQSTSIATSDVLQTIPAATTLDLQAVPRAATVELKRPDGNYEVTEQGKAEVYQAVPYKAPLFYVLQKMKWQFGASILLILFTTSCFIYMLITIFMQRKLSVVKNDMINNMTHELKTPLSTVSVAIEAMRNYEVLEDKDKTSLYLNVSKNELDHLSRLIEMILELSVFEHHKMVLFKEQINVNHLIEEIIKKYSLADDPASIELYADNFPEILADPIHLGNAVRNLIDNAIKYSLTRPKITIRSYLTKKGWALTVSDQGIGIPEVYQKSVFDQFFRVPDKRLQRIKGFGLGLAYVKQVAEQHQGTISLYSREGNGCIFTILIPVKLLKT
ncbi:HAMP domain-containing sensor histidine kinase [Pedobacter sp. UYP1]|uniref:sensor histidine kinase n=1 Tax=Pedobacter sp. UYP1 TaxID=1756396 RepID=UPI00339A6E10